MSNAVDQVASAAGLAALGSVLFASVPALVAPLAGFSHAMYVLAVVSVPIFAIAAILVLGMPRKARDEDTIELLKAYRHSCGGPGRPPRGRHRPKTA